jgi:type II secretion system protein I
MKRITCHGFTLIEVLQALVIFSVAFVGFVSLLVGTLQGNIQAKQRTEAATLAQDKLEELRQSTPITAGSDSVTSPSGKTFSRAWTVGAGPTASMQSVTVTVSWTDHSAQTVQLSTFINP